MEYDDSMDLSSPPCTPKPISRSLRPSTPYKSNAAVISLDSTPEPCDNTANHLTADFLEFEPNYTADNNDDDDFPPDFTSPTQHRDNKIPPLKLSRPRTYVPEHHSAEKMQYTSEVLDHMFTSLPTASDPPAIAILLLLTPNPASITVIGDLEEFAARFSADFSSVTYEERQQWHSINLYEHCHVWAARNPLSNGNRTARATGSDDNMEGVASVDDVGIGSIHPYALHAKLEQEREVNWRLALPVLKSLIDRQVKWGRRRFVVCGLKVGDVEGVRGFARKIAEPSGIFAFLPAPAAKSIAVVPMEHMSRTVMINNTAALSLPQVYNALLAALYVKQLSSPLNRTNTHADAINYASAHSRALDDYGDEDEDRFKEDIMMEWM